LPSDALSAGTQFDFLVKSVDPAGNTTTSDNGTFTTKGMSLQVKVIDSSNKAVKGVEVSLGSKSAKTDKDGYAVLTDLPAGKQHLKLKSGNKITTASVIIQDNGNSKLQTTTVKITPGGSSALHIIVPVIIVLIVLGAIAAIIVKRRGGSGFGGFGPLTKGPEGKIVAPVEGPKAGPSGVLITPVGYTTPPTTPTPTPAPAAPPPPETKNPSLPTTG